jgi:hypothetical protein
LWPLLRESGYRVVATSRWGINPPVRGPRSATLRVARCWALGDPSGRQFRRILAGDPRLAARHWAHRVALEPLKAALGATRYLRWRERVLNALGNVEENGR